MLQVFCFVCAKAKELVPSRVSAEVEVNKHFSMREVVCTANPLFKQCPHNRTYLTHTQVARLLVDIFLR
jgi:hypothetical protein